MIQENQILDFIARLCLVLIFPFSALDKIFNHQSAMAQAGHGLIALPDTMAALLLVLGRCSAACSRSSGLSAFSSIFIVGRRRSCSSST